MNDTTARKDSTALITAQRDRIKSEADQVIGTPADMRDIKQTYGRRYAADTAEHLAGANAKANLAAAGDIDGDRVVWLRERTAHHMTSLAVALNEVGQLIVVEK